MLAWLGMALGASAFVMRRTCLASPWSKENERFVEQACCSNQSTRVRINYYLKPLRFEVVCFAASLQSQLIAILSYCFNGREKEICCLLHQNQPPISVHPKTCLSVSYRPDVHSVLERDLACELCQARLTDSVSKETMISYFSQLAYYSYRQQNQEQQMCQFSVFLVPQDNARTKGVIDTTA